MAIKKRLIDAKEGKKVFVALARPAEYKGVIHMVVPISEIDRLPTVDAVEVVHAHWKYDAHGDPYCSNCERYPGLLRIESAIFCPKCGAKMDGGSNEIN